MKIINFEKKKMITLTNEECESYLNKKKLSHFAKESLNINALMIKHIVELKIIDVIQISTEVLAYVI